MPNQNHSEAESSSNSIAVASYVLAIVFLILGLFGYGHLHESWPPEIDGSVQKCLIIAFVLFLIPSVKELNIVGVLSFKAKVEEARAEVKEAKAEVKEAKHEIRSLMQIQNSLMSASMRQELNLNLKPYVGPDKSDAEQADQSIGEKIAATGDQMSLRAKRIAKMKQDLEPLGLPGFAVFGGVLEARVNNVSRALRDAISKHLDDSAIAQREDVPSGMELMRLWYLLAHRKPALQVYGAAMRYVWEVKIAYEGRQVVPVEEANYAFEVGVKVLVSLQNIGAKDPTG